MELILSVQTNYDKTWRAPRAQRRRTLGEKRIMSREKKFIQRCFTLATAIVIVGLQCHCRTMVVNMVWAVDKGKEDLTLAML